MPSLSVNSGLSANRTTKGVCPFRGACYRIAAAFLIGARSGPPAQMPLFLYAMVYSAVLRCHACALIATRDSSEYHQVVKAGAVQGRFCIHQNHCLIRHMTVADVPTPADDRFSRTMVMLQTSHRNRQIRPAARPSAANYQYPDGRRPAWPGWCLRAA